MNFLVRGIKPIYNLGTVLIPERIKRKTYPFLARIKRRYPFLKPIHYGFGPYTVRILHPVKEDRPVVVHAIANFMLGGSSRLVVDLIERMGHLYDQKVITSCITDPPAYAGTDIREYRPSAPVSDIFHFLIECRPRLLHIHYWGHIDEPWYRKIFEAAEHVGCRIIENINTPIEPYRCDSVAKYIYVSRYVQETFRCGSDEKSATIYPGSDFSLFRRNGGAAIPDDSIGMVYRLEMDKLNQKSIEVFIKVAKRRPGTKIHIIGGGTYLNIYKKEVFFRGVSDAFTFTDYVPYQKLPSYYEKMSIFVAPVWKESFGHVSPIAMHMGIPVVGYNVGALGEIIGNHDLLAPAGDSDRLATIIIDLLNDRRKRLSIGEYNKKRAEDLFSVEAMIAKYGQLYDSLLT